MNRVTDDRRLESRRRGTEVGGQETGPNTAAVRLGGRVGAVGGQIEHLGYPGEALAPVVELPFQDLSPQPGTLPDGVVGVLDRQLRKGGGLAAPARGIEDGELAHQQRHRQAVRDDVVEVEEEHVLLLVPRGEPQQQGAQEGSRREVERPLRLGCDQGSHRLVPRSIRQAGEVEQRNLPAVPPAGSPVPARPGQRGRPSAAPPASPPATRWPAPAPGIERARAGAAPPGCCRPGFRARAAAGTRAAAAQRRAADRRLAALVRSAVPEALPPCASARSTSPASPATSGPRKACAPAARPGRPPVRGRSPVPR